MACPFFVPRDVLNDGSWPHPSRLPLGAGWTGECCAAEAAHLPEPSEIREFCNLGYATLCPRLPHQRDWDAVRFSVAHIRDGQITLHYVCELAHAPVEHGRLTFDVNQETWLNVHADARVRRLADCYLQSYRTRQVHTVTE